MAQEYYNLAKAAEVLGISPAEVNQKRERGSLHGYRDGADWKFKKEEIDGLLAENIKSRSGQDDDALLLDDGDLGMGDDEATMLSDRGSLADLVGLADSSLSNDDLTLGDDDLIMADDDLVLNEDSVVDDASADDEDSIFTLASEESLEEATQLQSPSAGGSSVDVAGLDDDDVVLGGAGSGSDLNLGGDSGISLIDPNDSGLSLDDPVEILGGSDNDMELELGEDDMLSLTDADVDTDTATELQPSEDFLLTPMDEGSDDDSESSSQVIALDSDEDMGDLLGLGGGGNTPLMEDVETTDLGLEAELSGFDQPTDLGLDTAPAAEDPGISFEPVAASPATATVTTTVAAETPYSGMMIWLGLVPCVLLLTFCCIISVDLIRNMWSWDQPFELNNSIMVMIIDMLGG